MEVLERLLPKVGDLIHGRFRIESELGRGGFGIVYKAVQTSLGRPVAIKILLPHILSNQDLVDRFIREVEVVKELRHPHTIGIVDFGRTNAGIPFYVMEYVDGTPLDELLKTQGPLGEQRTQHVAVQLLKSLAEAHSTGIIHRDLKPANVMICEVFGETDYVKVLDFGIAKALAVDGSGHKTQTGMILGSPPYMSPEQAFGKDSLDGRSDLYSVGLIMAECVSGQRVVEAQSMMQVLAMHVSKEPLPFNDVVRRSALWPIIERATQKDRELRWSSAAEMRQALEQLGAALSSGTAFAAASFGQAAAALTPTPTPYPTQSPSTPTPSPQMMPGQATPTPAPAPGPGGVQPQVAAVEEPVDPAAPTAAVEPLRVSRGLLVALLVLVLAGGALAVVITQTGGDEELGMGAGSGSPSGRADAGEHADAQVASRSDARETATGQSETSEPVGPDAGAETGEHVASATGPTGPQDEPNVEQGERLARLSEGVGAAREALHLAIPPTREISFEGTEGADILLGDQVVGRTPEPLVVPALDVNIDLRFRRAGYRSRTEEVNLASTDTVHVRLRRERDETETQTETETETETETVGPGEIPGVTIHR